MKKQHLILLTAAIVLGVIIYDRDKRIISEPFNVIKPGDKGKDVFGLQGALTSLTGIKLANMGVYDNETLSAVQYYMGGSNALHDYEKGYVDRNFASDLFFIQEQARKV